MKDSTTYQMIVEEGVEKGRLDEARKILFELGRIRLGKPGKLQNEAIAAINDVSQRELLSHRLLEVDSWQQLLAAK